MVAVVAIQPVHAQDAARRIERGTLILDGVPEVPVAIRSGLNQYQEVRAAYFEDWSADGQSLYISTRFGNTSQIHRVDVPLGMRRQITFFPEPVGGATVQPEGHGFIFPMDTGGDEYDQLFFFDTGTGQWARLTDGLKSLNRGARWSKDGQWLAYTHTPEGSQRYQVKVAAAGDLTNARTVLDRDGFWFAGSWSYDASHLAVYRTVSAAERYLHVLDVATGELRELNPGKGVVAYGGAAFSPDGQSLYTTSDEGSEFMRLVRFDLATGAQVVLTPGLDWDVDGFDLSPDGRTLIYVVNESGLHAAYRMDTQTAESTCIGIPVGVFYGGGFSPDGSRFAFTLNRAVSPADVYVYDLTSGDITQWTDSEVGGLDKATFVDASLLRYASFDGREITAFVQEPAQADGPLPVIINIHGGPEGQFTPTFSSIRQYWVNELGFAVIAPNVRGSEGFGKTFLSLDNGMLREDSIKDLEALVDWIHANPRYDGSRIVVYGGSYGGFMVNAAMTMFPDKLAGGVSIVGISDLATFLQNTAEYRRDLRRVEYGDERDPQMRAEMDRLSPLKHANQVTKPFFVIGGGNDPRVPASESEQMVAAARANGASAWLMIATDEGHGYGKKENRDAMNEAVVLFLKTQILAH